MHEEVENKVYKKDYEIAMTQQNALNELVCAKRKV